MRRKGWTVRALGAHQLDERGLPSWMTFTRGAGSWSRQTAPAVDGTTFIELGTAQNTGRFDYDPVSGRTMLLVEPTRTNYNPGSNFADVAPANNIPDGWSLNNGVAGTDFTTAPGGPHGGAQLRLENTGNASGVNIATTLPATAFWMSVWLRGTSVAARTWYGQALGGGPYLTGATPEGTYEWQRYLLSDTTTAPNTANLMVALAAAGLIQCALPQVEAGDCATSVIPTNGAAVTRAAELCTIDTDRVGRTSGYLSLLWRPDYASTTALTVSPVLFAWAPNWELYFDPADDKLKLLVDGVAGAESAALTFARQAHMRVTVRYGAAGTQLTVGTAAPTTDASAWGTPTLACFLGSRAASVNCRPAAYGDIVLAAA